jgi:hypothetical protein
MATGILTAMPEIVAIHGILNEFLGPSTLESDWTPRIHDGLWLAGYTRKPTIRCAYYGDLFRPPGTKASGPPALAAADVAEGLEEALLLAWWAAAASAEPATVTPPDGDTKVRWSAMSQRAIKGLIKSRFFRGLAGRHGERALIFALQQVRMYLEDASIRETAQARLRACLTDDTRVVVAHSLGSVVAYETLAARTDGHPVSLVTLGSPLGMSPIVFDRLKPSPANGLGAWPNVTAWWNVSDSGDIVAIVKELRPLFGDAVRVTDVRVNNGWQSHDMRRYLTARETGEAIASGL